MNALIDLRWMVPGRVGGLELMAYELVSAIIGVNRIHRSLLRASVLAKSRIDRLFSERE